MLSKDTQPFDFISSNLIGKLKSNTLRRIFTSEMTGDFAIKNKVITFKNVKSNW